MAEADLKRFTPVAPARPEKPGPFWGLFVGERAKNTVEGWSAGAFDMPYRKRRMLGWTVHIVTDPDALQRVLLDHSERYEKPRIIKRLIAPLVGRGLLSSDGELWRGQRKMVAPTFAPAAVAALTPLIAKAAVAQAESWPRDEARLDMAHEATSATMTIIADALFSGDPRLTSDAARAHIAAALNAAAAARIAALLHLPAIGWTQALREGRRGRKYLRATLGEIVRERGPSGGGDDFLGQMIRALGQQFPQEEALALALDNATTFWAAGHETTANALAWTFYLLGSQPEAQARCRAECAAALAQGEDDQSLADRLPYTRAVLDEAMRLYPPAPRFDRECVAADALCGEAVNPGDIVSIWPWLIHRQARLWDLPDAFRPERFLPGGSAEKRHRFQYIPFGGGPHTCVGMRFAIVEALTILAHWLTRREFALENARDIYPVGAVTLRPRGGVLVRSTPLP